ncbi:hypothetical protein X992_5518 [Burkholderia pseudomallei MSHR5492]|nr:hypothetical protein X992_5518 [Burkholderia pseudomallei MSHR5492]
MLSKIGRFSMRLRYGTVKPSLGAQSATSFGLFRSGNNFSPARSMYGLASSTFSWASMQLARFTHESTCSGERASTAR